METFVKYPSIDNFKQFRHNLMKQNPLIEDIQLEGTVKIHGTNAGFVLWKGGNITVQSRNRILSLDSDNQGFARFIAVTEAQKILKPSAKSLLKMCDGLAVYGEWCGGNIQGGVGVSGMEKAFVVFGLSLIKNGEIVGMLETEFLQEHINTSIPRVFTINQFKTYKLTINPQEVEKCYEKLDELTLQVEDNCPVAAELNPHGNKIGEGIVWNLKGYPQHRFKHKGTKHQRASREPKRIKEENPEVFAAFKEFAEVALSEDRLMQGIEYLQEMQLDPYDKKNTGEYIKWVNKDILKECALELEELERDKGITWKQIASKVSTVARQFYMSGNF